MPLHLCIVVDKCRQRRFADAPYTGQHQGRGVWIDEPAIDNLYDMFALLGREVNTTGIRGIIL